VPGVVAADAFPKLALQRIKPLHQRIGRGDRLHPATTTQQRDTGVIGLELLDREADHLLGRAIG